FLQFFTEGTQQLSETGADEFLKLLVFFGIAVGVCQWIALVLDSLLGEWLRLTVGIGLKRSAVESLGRTRLDALDAAERGDWMTRLSSDIYNAEDFLTNSLPEQITNATMMVGAAVLFFHHSGPIALIPLVAALFLGWFNIVVQKRMAPTLAEARKLEGGVFQTMIETFEGLRTIRSYGGEESTLKRLNVRLKELFKAGMSITKSMALLMGVNELVGQIVVTGLLTLVAYQVRGEHLTAIDALVYPFFINLFLGAAKGLVSSAFDWNRFFIEGGRLASLLYDEEKKVEDPIAQFGDFCTRTSEVRTFSANSISIAYGEGSSPVVHNQDLLLHRGEVVALMGESGCGKSTFTESVAGLRPATSGTFLVQFEDGSSVSFDQPPPFLSAFVQQQPYLFVGTVRENITLGSPFPNDEVAWSALQETGLDDLMDRRGGLDHVLADRGQNLSVGQQYRLALCRALVSRRPFLLLDEPFASLDKVSIQKVIDTIQAERDRGAGILLVTHQLPDDLEPDRVVTMD
ncbi:MAG: ABC transporter ATP-binding protein, partial [Verrucomicrobiota bacterium]